MAQPFDIFRIILSATLLDQEVKNVFHYQATTVDSLDSPFATALLTAFVDDVLPAIRAVQSEGVQYGFVDVQNLNDLSEFQGLQLNFTGDIPGQTATSFAAWSFQLNPFSKAIRWGRKSIAGVNEVSLDGNDAAPAIIGDLLTLDIALGAILTLAGGSQCFPVVARIPTPEVLPYIPFAVGVSDVIFRGVGSQLTRKKGRGA